MKLTNHGAFLSQLPVNDMFFPSFNVQWLTGVPNATTFFGCINKDEFGKIMENKAKEAGVNTQFQYTDKEPTGTCAVIVTGKNRYRIRRAMAITCSIILTYC